jgi:hypothetical protein
LVFPQTRWFEANAVLRGQEAFASWTYDPVPSSGESTEPLAFKYHGYCSRNTKIRAELQIVPMLIGLFWEVEHSAIYKPTPELKGVLSELGMQQHTEGVYKALRNFEIEFERLVRRDPFEGR